MITRAKLSSVVQGLPKYRSMLAGNSPYSPTAFNSIATVITDGTTGTVTFSSIPTGYVSLQIRYAGSINYGSLNNSSVSCLFNGDSNYANYYAHDLRGNGGAGGISSNSGTFPRVAHALDSTSPVDILSVAIIDIHNYTSTTQNKVFRSFAGFNSNQGATSTERIGLYSGVWLNTAAITSITITGLDGNWGSGGSFALYGIAGD